MFSPTPSRFPQSLLTDLYRMYFPLLRAKCRRMLSAVADAEDVAQEVFVRLLESDLLTRREAPSQPEILAWLYRTSTRAAIDKLRRQRVRARFQGSSRSAAESPDHAEARADGASAEDAVYARRLIEHVARSVPGKELEVVILHRLDLLTQPEIAAVASLSERTVRRLLRRFDERVTALSHRSLEERA